LISTTSIYALGGGVSIFSVKGAIYTNTIEGYFSILKRGLTGVYQHCKSKHLKKYIGEFDFRYNNRKVTDAKRTDIALLGIGGKRLMYR